LIPSFKKIDDLSDEERGSNFQAGVATLQPASPRSSQVTETIDKLSGRVELHSRSVDLLDDTSNHYLNCYGYIAECISKAERKLNMSGNVDGMACTKEAEVPGLYPRIGVNPAVKWVMRLTKMNAIMSCCDEENACMHVFCDESTGSTHYFYNT
jgi:hypothetical protein